MKKWHEKWYENWENGMYGVLLYDLISFYSYFTIVFAEIVVLWLHYQKIALPFTIFLSLSLINILAISYFKGKYEGTKLELVFTVVFWVIFAGTFIPGFFFDVMANLILFAIPIGFTGLSVVIRFFQNTKFSYGPQFILAISKAFESVLVWIFTQFIVLFIPYYMLVKSVLSLPIDSFVIKIAICAVYGMIVPYFAYIEDEWGAQNIFELGFSVVWNPELEEAIEEFNKRYQENPEAVEAEIQEFFNQVLEAAKNANEDIQDIDKS